MKKLLILSLSVFAFAACNTPAEPAENNDDATAVEVQAEESEEVLNYYGAKITPDGAIQSSELVEMLGDQDSMMVKVEGTINACCQKKGCWMDVDLGDGQSMVVRFTDYGFFVPKNASGQVAIMEGKAKVEMQSVEWLRHKAKDANKSEEEIEAITEPEMSVTFLADGVIIKGEIPPMEEDTETEEMATESTEAVTED